jgi:hypothetical protein
MQHRHTHTQQTTIVMSNNGAQAHTQNNQNNFVGRGDECAAPHTHTHNNHNNFKWKEGDEYVRKM